MSTTATRRGGDYELAPAGTHVARCYAVIDLGMQDSQWGPKPKVHIRWELCNEMMDNDGEPRPFSVGATYTNSTDPKANLRHMLESWAGKSMTAEQEKAFELEGMIGKACQVTISHEAGKRDPSKTYATVKAVTPLAKGMVAPKMANQKLHYQVEMGANETYNGLSEYLRKTIAQCKEWQEADKPEPSGGPQESEEPDNIPF